MFIHFIRRNQRDGYNFTQSENSAGNYFPLVTGILLKVRKRNRTSIVFLRNFSGQKERFTNDCSDRSS